MEGTSVSVSILFPRYLSQVLERVRPGCPQQPRKEIVLASRELRVYLKDKRHQQVSTEHDAAAVLWSGHSPGATDTRGTHWWHTAPGFSVWAVNYVWETCLHLFSFSRTHQGPRSFWDGYCGRSRILSVLSLSVLWLALGTKSAWWINRREAYAFI